MGERKLSKKDRKYDRGNGKEVFLKLCGMARALHRVLWVLPLRKPKARRRPVCRCYGCISDCSSLHTTHSTSLLQVKTDQFAAYKTGGGTSVCRWVKNIAPTSWVTCVIGGRGRDWRWHRGCVCYNTPTSLKLTWETRQQCRHLNQFFF